MGDPVRAGDAMREAGWDPPEKMQGGDPGPSLVDVMLKLEEMGALLKLINQTLQRGAPAPQQQAQPAQQGGYNPPNPPYARPQGGRPQGGGYGRGGGGGYNRPRQGPPQGGNRPAPGDGFPQAEERWFDRGLLDQTIQFGQKWNGYRWGDLLGDPEGREYLEWLVNSKIQQNGRNPNGWRGVAGRAALWLLAFGDQHAGGGGGGQGPPPSQGQGGPGYTENVPF